MTSTAAHPASDEERLRRWRLVLGAAAEPALGELTGADDAAVDKALGAVYDTNRGGGRSGGDRSAGLGGSAPRVARWLGDIRTYFPSTVVEVMQRDAVERLGLTQLLLEPELMEAVEPDVHLVGTLLSLNRVIPETTKSTARMVVGKVVKEIEERIATRTVAAVSGAGYACASVASTRASRISCGVGSVGEPIERSQMPPGCCAARSRNGVTLSQG